MFIGSSIFFCMPFCTKNVFLEKLFYGRLARDQTPPSLLQCISDQVLKILVYLQEKEIRRRQVEGEINRLIENMG